MLQWLIADIGWLDIVTELRSFMTGSWTLMSGETGLLILLLIR